MILADRLRMRPLEEADVAQLRKILGDPQVMAFCGGSAGEKRLLQAVRNCRKCQEDHGYSPLAALTGTSDALIGICGLKSLQDSEGAGLIHHFVAEVWSQGYATESVRALLSWAHRNLQIRYVEASFDERNAASRNVLVETGFTYREDRWSDDVQQQQPVYRFELRSSP